MQKITPHLWFVTQAKEAAEFYASAFSALGGRYASQITNISAIHDTPSGDCDIVSFTIAGACVYGDFRRTAFYFQPLDFFHGQFRSVAG